MPLLSTRSHSANFNNHPSSSSSTVHRSSSHSYSKPTDTDTCNPYELVDQINRHHDLYLVLGLSGYSFYNRHQIKVHDIRKAYISRSRLCHPDKLPEYEPCTAAFQKLSLAYETLSKPSSRRIYDLTTTNSSPLDRKLSSIVSIIILVVLVLILRGLLVGDLQVLERILHQQLNVLNRTDVPRPKPSRKDTTTTTNNEEGDDNERNDNKHSNGINADETLNGVLHSTFCEFMEGDFEMIRVVINALNEGNPGLNLGEEVVNSVETGFKTMRNKMIIGSKYIRILKFELMKLFELQANLRSLSYFNFLGRLRLSLALVRVTISIPIRIDQIMRNGFDSSSSSSDEEEEEDDGPNEINSYNDNEGKKKQKNNVKKRAGILPNKITGLLEATVDILERGERATSIWNSSSPAADLSHPHQSPHSTEKNLD
ncbi:hypothetical protein Pst134EA_032846 [Puccinia striiformis f. sp. tritici]|uniref:uncharacterized protein n=1 Tax=Puccinia striiformis f. sp. tritici TaxID=168172 RepID=UPI002008367E|nr:uncharacterized protein Pst134EA_032846 [Puccinia striiformis f. sp. tritici]KAH9441582.1 hypothetical protein Pst134EA_032846 [Puccinia striiformis f. sp. tritici]